MAGIEYGGPASITAGIPLDSQDDRGTSPTSCTSLPFLALSPALPYSLERDVQMH